MVVFQLQEFNQIPGNIDIVENIPLKLWKDTQLKPSLYMTLLWDLYFINCNIFH